MPRRRIERNEPRPLKAEKRWVPKCRRTGFASQADAQIAVGEGPFGRHAELCPRCGMYHILADGETLAAPAETDGE